MKGAGQSWDANNRQRKKTKTLHEHFHVLLGGIPYFLMYLKLN